jgi:hypothetical protein
MHAVQRIWETDYQHDRRVHRHRCHCCARIVDTGERVLMWRIGRGTKLVHIQCAVMTPKQHHLYLTPPVAEYICHRRS